MTTREERVRQLAENNARPDKIGITFGATAPSLQAQLREQNIARFAGLNILQRTADALTMASVQGVLTDTETRRARKRLLEKIREAIARI